MKSLQEFRIPYVGLKNGLHTFFYTIDKSFFAHFDFSLVNACNISVEALLDKREAGFFTLQIDLKGVVDVECDRCSDMFQLPIQRHDSIIIKFENEGETPEEEVDVMYISRQDTSFDIAHLIYEFVHLALPIQKIHPDDTQGKSMCNIDVIKHLSKNKQEIKNEPDERWAVLKQLKTKK